MKINASAMNNYGKAMIKFVFALILPQQGSMKATVKTVNANMSDEFVECRMFVNGQHLYSERSRNIYTYNNDVDAAFWIACRRHANILEISYSKCIERICLFKCQFCQKLCAEFAVP